MECSAIVPLLRVDAHQYLCHPQMYLESGRPHPCPILLYKEKQLQSKRGWFEIKRILVEWTNSEQNWLPGSEVSEAARRSHWEDEKRRTSHEETPSKRRRRA
eukprot:GILJ01003217.1.p3 GENE.GILJ01003217.1~~GILJ01003217.1.p3  ORF type:complete len:102 (-),score=4.10 GILJ01003217.1:260-565(-)